MFSTMEGLISVEQPVVHISPLHTITMLLLMNTVIEFIIYFSWINTSTSNPFLLIFAGNIAQPKWGHLKELHSVLKSMEETITNGKVLETDFGNSVKATVYATNGSSSCFLSNTNTTTDATLTFRGNKYTIPAWSVSLLPDCHHEEYNTAKVRQNIYVFFAIINYYVIDS